MPRASTDWALLLLCAGAACQAARPDDGGSAAGTSTTGDLTEAGTIATSAGTADTGGVSLAETYCACMLVNCHEEYHGTWGREHDAAWMACLEEASALPTAGMAVSSGNFLECRLEHCRAARVDSATCPAAVGMAACAR